MIKIFYCSLGFSLRSLAPFSSRLRDYYRCAFSLFPGPWKIAICILSLFSCYPAAMGLLSLNHLNNPKFLAIICSANRLAVWEDVSRAGAKLPVIVRVESVILHAIRSCSSSCACNNCCSFSERKAVPGRSCWRVSPSICWTSPICALMISAGFMRPPE